MNLNQVTVPAVDVEASVEFYKKLGLVLIVDSMPRYARFQCPDGEASFSVESVTQVPAGEGIVVYFEFDNLDQEVQRLIEKGINFDSGPTDQPWLWREARLRDPSGNRLCLFQAGNNRLNPPWRINAHSYTP